MSTATAEVNRILREIDCLGFDNVHDARLAILESPDWYTRYDWTGVSNNDLYIIADWYAAMWRNYRSYRS